jgi:Putative adhesin
MASAATSTPTTARSFPLTAGRRAALAVGVPVCLALVGAGAFSLVANVGEGKYHVTKTAPAGTTALTLNVTGQLTIAPTEAHQAELSGTASYGLVRAAVTEHTAGDATTFGYGCPVPAGNCELDATVTIPASVTTLTASSGAGNATVTGTTGPVSLSTGDGNLSVGHASGPLHLNTDSGSIEVSAISRSAAVSASTGQGNITADGVAATTISANTDSGSIAGSGVAAGTITAASGQGEIVIAFSSVPGAVRVNTNSGNIKLILPRTSTAYHIAANTDSGTVSDGTVPQSPSSSHVITASSGSGNITILEQ